VSLRSDIAADSQYIEGVESVTFTPQNPAAAAINNVKALLDLRGGNPLVAATVGVDPSDSTWHLWDSALGSTEPKNGDIITQAGGTVWTITAVGESLMAGRFICSAKQRS
jgi:hypothetical protein